MILQYILKSEIITEPLVTKDPVGFTSRLIPPSYKFGLNRDQTQSFP